VRAHAIAAAPRLSDAALAAWDDSLLADFPDEATFVLRAHALEAELPTGALLNDSDDATAPAVALIVDGLVRSFRRSTDGREATVRYAGAAEVVGLVGLVSRAGGVALQTLTATRVVRLPAGRFADLIRRDARVAWPITGHLAEMVHTGQELLADDVFLSVRARVARHLLDLTERDGERFVVRASHKALADAIGSVREVVARTLRALEYDGLIARDPGAIALLDLAALHAAALGGRRRCRRRPRVAIAPADPARSA
jgi:CRP-like cAMP-binding protein